MRLVHEPPHHSGHDAPVPHAVTGDEAGALERILEPDVNLAVWRRRLSANFTRELQSALAPLSGEVSQSVGSAPDDLRPFLAPFPPALHRRLARELSTCVQVWCRLDGRPKAQLKLAIVRDSGCRKFHVDHVGLRLLCTLVGPGTEWLPEEAVDRKRLGLGSIDEAEPNDVICTNPAATGRLASGDIGVFKGERQASMKRRGIVHRSPPADPLRRPRLVVTVDDGYDLVDPRRKPIHAH